MTNPVRQDDHQSVPSCLGLGAVQSPRPDLALPTRSVARCVPTQPSPIEAANTIQVPQQCTHTTTLLESCNGSLKRKKMGTTDATRLWQRAVSFAAQRHQGQFRKDGKTPYFAHPVRVALVVRHVFESNDQTALVAALLHDLIEDTTTDYDELIEQFGQEAADAVAALTKDARLPEAEREAAYDRQLSQASWEATRQTGRRLRQLLRCPKRW